VSETGYTRKKGELVGGFRLEEPVGRGGFSEVWKATSATDPKARPVALKVLIHPEHVSQLRAEAAALALVRGEGILPVLAMDLANDPPYLALELVSGGDLRAHAREWRGGRLPPYEAVKVVEQILAILARVHKEGVVHGDLKPENVLKGERGALLADFGLSRRVSQGTATLSVSLSRDDARLAGTIDYMAPEQREGQKPTARSDVYALGVILYELLMGERPQGMFAFPSERDARCPPVIDRILACSLAKDPRHRLTSSVASRYPRL